MRVWEQVGELKDSSDCIGQGMETVGELKDSFDKDDLALPTVERRHGVVFNELKTRFRTRFMCQMCKEYQGHRAEIYAARVAKCLAAIEGRERVNVDDLKNAVEYYFSLRELSINNTQMVVVFVILPVWKPLKYFDYELISR